MIPLLYYWKYEHDSHRANIKVMWGQKLCIQANLSNVLKFYVIIF